MEKSNDKDKQIQMSVAYNNSCRLLSGVIASMPTSADAEQVSEAVDALARTMYRKQIAFWNEISNESHS